MDTWSHLWSEQLSERWLPLVGVVGAIVIVLVILWIVPLVQVRTSQLSEGDSKLELVNEYRKTLSQILGGAFLFLGIFLTWSQITIARKGATLDRERFIVERVDKREEELMSQQEGDPSVAIREIGSWNSHPDTSKEVHCRIQMVLESFIRAKRQKASSSPEGSADAPRGNGKRVVEMAFQQFRWNEQCPGRLSLADLDLRGLSLESVDLSRAILSNSDLGGSRLERVNLAGAELRGATFVETDLIDVLLDGATGFTEEQLESLGTFKNSSLPEYIEGRPDRGETIPAPLSKEPLVR